MTPGLGHLYVPKPVAVAVGPAGAPREVAGVAVESIREDWEVIDRWWTPRSLERRYYELALADGRSVVVFYGDPPRRWYLQRA